MIKHAYHRDLYEYVLASSAKVRKAFIELTQKILDEIVKIDVLNENSGKSLVFKQNSKFVEEVLRNLESSWNSSNFFKHIHLIENNFPLVSLPLSIKKAIFAEDFIYLMADSGFASVYNKKFILHKVIELNAKVIDVIANDKYFALATNQNQIFVYTSIDFKIIGSINLKSEYKLSRIYSNIILVVTKNCHCLKYDIECEKVIKEITIVNEDYKENPDFSIDFIEISNGNKLLAFGSRFSGKIIIYICESFEFKITLHSPNLLISLCFYNNKDICFLDYSIRKNSYEIIFRDIDELLKLSLGSYENPNESKDTKSSTQGSKSIELDDLLDSDSTCVVICVVEEYLFVYGENGKVLWAQIFADMNFNKFSIDDHSYPVCFFKSKGDEDLFILTKSGNIHKYNLFMEYKKTDLQLINNQIEFSSICALPFYILLGSSQGDIFVYSSSYTMTYLKCLNYHKFSVTSIQALKSSFFSLSIDSNFIEWNSKSFEIIRVLSFPNLTSFILNTNFILSIYSDNKFSITQHKNEYQVKKYKVNSVNYDLICHQNSNLFALFDSKGVVKFLDIHKKTHHSFEAHINTKLLIMTQDNCLILLEEKELIYFDFKNKQKIPLGVFNNVKTFAMDDLCLFLMTYNNFILKFDLENAQKEEFYLKDNVILNKILIYDKKLIFYGYPSYCAVFNEGFEQEMVLNDLNIIVKESLSFKVFGLMNGSVFVQAREENSIFEYYYKLPNAVCFISVNEESIIVACTDRCLIITKQRDYLHSNTYQSFDNIPLKYQIPSIKPYFIPKR